MNISLYGISPSSWHYSSKTACIGMMVSCQAMTWIWYFTIILAPFIQNSLWYYKLEYSTNVSEAEESNRQQANLPLHSQSRESTTLFSPAIRQAIDQSLQSGNIYTLLTSINHPTAYVGMLVSQCHEPSDSSHVYALHSLPTRSNSPTACMYTPFNICRLHLKVLFMNNAKAIWHRSLMHIAMITEL